MRCALQLFDEEATYEDIKTTKISCLVKTMLEYEEDEEEVSVLSIFNFQLPMMAPLFRFRGLSRERFARPSAERSRPSSTSRRRTKWTTFKS